MYTIFGGHGFIGSEFVKALRMKGHEVYIPERDDHSIFLKNLGNVIYAAGYGNCLENPQNVVDANLTLLNKVLYQSKFESLTYLSSTRVYVGDNETSEASDITVSLTDARRLFNLSKLTAEELCFKSGRRCLIVRPSNVYGTAIESNLFLPSIIRDSLSKGIVNMYVTEEYKKDYVYVGDVVNSTLELIQKEVTGIVNIAYGKNISAKKLAEVLIKNTNCEIKWHVTNDIDFFNKISIEKIRSLIEYNPRCVLNDMESMIKNYKVLIDLKNNIK